MGIESKMLEDVMAVLPTGDHPTAAEQTVGISEDDEGEFIWIGLTDPDVFSDHTELRKILSGTRYKIQKLDGTIKDF